MSKAGGGDPGGPAGGHFIAGERMRAGTPYVEQVLARQGRYRTVRDNLRVKEVDLESAPGLRWVLRHNPDEATRAAAQRDAALDRIRTELARIKTARDRLATATPTTAAAARRREAELASRARRVRAAVSPGPGPLAAPRHPRPAGHRHRQGPRRGPPRRQVPAGTSDPDLSAEDVALGYKNLLKDERGFRDMKSTLELRPVNHRLEPRIRVHVLLCWLALLLIRVAERRSEQT